MCFSAEASLGVAVALLPAGAYCVDASWRKDRRYLLLAAVPIVFGTQQLCEALVWLGIDRNDPRMAQTAALAYLAFALAIWPVWIPLAFAVLDSRRRMRMAMGALAGFGLLFGLAFLLPLATVADRRVNPAVIGHSIRYDLSGVPLVHSFWWWAWLAVYLVAVSVPLLISGNNRLRTLGAGVIVSAIASYAAFEYAFASVWCFFAAILSLYLVRTFSVIPSHVSKIHEPHLRSMPSN